MRGLSVSFILLFCFNICLKAQSITPFTLNIGGLTTTQGGYSLTISTGETISITNFVTPAGISLSSGFLQENPPLVTGIEEINTPFSVNEIKITPNPVKTILHLYSDLNSGGQLQYQIMDIGSRVLYRSQAFTTYGSMQNQIDFTNYATGQYYIQVYFKPNTGKVKSGIYKIIKL